MAQPLKKKEVKTKPTISSFKEKLGLKSTKDASNADKPMEWLIMPKAFQDALKLPGLPIGYVNTIIGHSNTGKSTLINHAIVSAQQEGYIPVIYDTENNFDFSYAIDMGMDAEPVYEDVEVELVDPDTGEVTTEVRNMITSYEGNFIYFNNALLAARYGKMDYTKGGEGSKCRKLAVIEDIAYSMNELLDAQDEGEIENGFVFIWDSVGSIQSWKSYNAKASNAMWDAASISVAFNTILNDRIPRSRKVSSSYSNTFIAVNKVWLDSMTNPMAPPSIQLKGGNSIYYASRLIVLMGGQLKASVKKLTAVAKGFTYQYATQTKIKSVKNQLPSPYTLSYEGELVCTATGFVSPEKDVLDAYRKEHVSDMLKVLNDIAAKNNEKFDATVYDISFTESEEMEQ